MLQHDMKQAAALQAQQQQQQVAGRTPEEAQVLGVPPASSVPLPPRGQDMQEHHHQQLQGPQDSLQPNGHSLPEQQPPGAPTNTWDQQQQMVQQRPIRQRVKVTPETAVVRAAAVAAAASDAPAMQLTQDVTYAPAVRTPEAQPTAALAEPAPPQTTAGTADQSLSFRHRLVQPFSWSRAEASALQGLPLPPVLHSLLLLHRHLETCYSFLLQQHIQPRWGRLLGLMGSLFPQVRAGGQCFLQRC